MKNAPALLLSLIALGLSAQDAGAQACIGPDGLEGSCWEPTTAILPDFPSLDLPGLGVCWLGCELEDQGDLQLVVDTPLETRCGQYRAALTATPSGAASPVLQGMLYLDYTRTWLELAPQGRYQVWRFVAKVDLAGDPFGGPGGPPGCPVPSCIGSLPTAFFYGYVDFALDCNSGEWESAVVLFHNADAWIHGQNSSSTPGFGLHPERTFALVAPHTPENPFDPTQIISHPNGEALAGSVRNVGHPMDPGWRASPITSMEESS